jgi:hypothetical protein
MRVREKKAHMESLSPGMMRGTAFDNEDDDEEAVSKPVHNMRYDTWALVRRGRSWNLRQEGVERHLIMMAMMTVT